MENIENLASSLTHDELLEVTKSSLDTLMSCEPLFSDLPQDIVLEEVLSQIAVEHGQAITVLISREEEPALKVILIIGLQTAGDVSKSELLAVCKDPKKLGGFVVDVLTVIENIRYGVAFLLFLAATVLLVGIILIPQNATVRELKKAIARHFEFHQNRTGSKVKISWKYIWRTYDLNFDGIILDDDNSNIDNYGVSNKVVLTFKKRKRK